MDFWNSLNMCQKIPNQIFLNFSYGYYEIENADFLVDDAQIEKKCFGAKIQIP